MAQQLPLSIIILKCLQSFGIDKLAVALATQNDATEIDEKTINNTPSKNAERELLLQLLDEAISAHLPHYAIAETRPKSLECDVVRFQNNKEKWVAFVGLLDGYPYEIFTGVLDDEDGIALPKTVSKGFIVKNTEPDGSKHYDFQFVNRRGYKTTIEGLSEKFNKEYWNYAKLISGVLRYRMPISNVIKLVSSLQLDNENINTWKVGVERALKKYAVSDDSNDVSLDTNDSVKDTGKDE